MASETIGISQMSIAEGRPTKAGKITVVASAGTPTAFCGNSWKNRQNSEKFAKKVTRKSKNPPRLVR
jgi:hypothetical protein